MKKQTMAALLLLALLLALALAANTFFSPRGEAGKKSITVEVEHLSGDTARFAWETEAVYLRGAMEEKGLLAGEEGPYGLWVTSVDGETADESQQQWWGYTVNGAEAAYGVDAQPLADGDVFVFTLHVGY